MNTFSRHNRLQEFFSTCFPCKNFFGKSYPLPLFGMVRPYTDNDNPLGCKFLATQGNRGVFQVSVGGLSSGCRKLLLTWRYFVSLRVPPLREERVMNPKNNLSDLCDRCSMRKEKGSLKGKLESARRDRGWEKGNACFSCSHFYVWLSIIQSDRCRFWRFITDIFILFPFYYITFFFISRILVRFLA